MSVAHKLLLAAGLLLASSALVGCVTTTVDKSFGASPTPTLAPVATPTATLPATSTPAATVVPSVAPSTPSASPSSSASSSASSEPITTPIPGSSLDPTLSDAGVAGRITIPNDTRNEWTGTHEILGRMADGSACSPSFDGDRYGAVAWYDAAPNGMIHQMSVSLPIDEMPANDGEERVGISDGDVYVDFVNETGFGSAYAGDATEENDGGSSTIDAVLKDGTLTFSFTATTWDDITFSGQMMCTGITSTGN